MADEKRIERAKAFLIDNARNHTPIFEDMADFASIEVAAKLREVVARLTKINNRDTDLLDYAVDIARFTDKLTAEADALEGK